MARELSEDHGKPLPVWFYTERERLIRNLLQKPGETIIIELQAEAWFESTTLIDVSPQLQRDVFRPDLFMANVDLARRTQVPRIYLWGVEWWYWMRARGYPEYIDCAQRVVG